MQIHELNSFSGTPSDLTYLAIDDGSETTKIGADSVGVSTAMTTSEAEAGTSTSKRVVTPAVFKSAVTTIMTNFWSAMTQSEAEAGTSTSKKVITPAVFKAAVMSLINSVAITTAMTQSEAEDGTVTSKRVITPSVFKTAVLSIISNSDVQAYNIKSLITPASGVTINTAFLYVYGGRVAQLYISVTFGSAQNADTSYDIGTLATDIKPRNLAPLTSTYGGGQINVGGGMSFRPQVNLQAGSQRSFNSNYLLNSKYEG